MIDRWENPEFWFGEIGRARNKRERYAGLYEWKKIVDLLDSGGLGVAVENESTKQNTQELSQSAFVNWVWAFCQIFVPAVYWKQPEITCAPKRQVYAPNAIYTQAMTNAALRETRFRRTLLRVLMDTLAYGIGCCKIGWFTRVGQVPGPAFTPNQKQKRTTIDTEMQFVVDKPFTIRVSPERIYFDPDASCYEELAWIAQESYVSYDDVKKDPYLKNTDDVAPLTMGAEDLAAFVPTTSVETEWQYKENRWCRLYEIWDRAHDRVMVLIQGSYKFNREVDWPYPDVYGFPYRLLQVTDAINDIYPPSVILPWLGLVEELSLIRAKRIEHIQKMKAKAIIPAGVFDPEQLEDFLDPEQDACVSQGDPNQIVQLTTVKPDANLYASEDSVKSDIREISGFSELMSGSVPYSRIAATTSAIMEQNSNLRFRHYSERVGEFIVDTAEQLFKIVRRFTPFPQQIQIVGEPNPQWVEISSDNLEGDYWFKMDLEEMSVASKQQRIKEKFDALSTLSQFPEVKRDALIKDFLLAIGVTNINDYLNPPQGPPIDPNYENQMMLQGVPVEPNPAEDFQLHLQVHEMMVRSPQYGQAVTAIPQIAALVSEHIQKTNRLANMAMQMQGGQGGGGGAGGGVSPTASMQSGSALPGSQPPGGPTNAGRGGGAAALQQAMSKAGGG